MGGQLFWKGWKVIYNAMISLLTSPSLPYVITVSSSQLLEQTENRMIDKVIL